MLIIKDEGVIFSFNTLLWLKKIEMIQGKYRPIQQSLRESLLKELN